MSDAKNEGTITVEMESMLRLLAESLYSRPDVCIRELLANAVDSLTAKEQLIRQGGLSRDEDLLIRIWYDGSGILTVQDTGLGMTRKEIQDFLTVVGRSGTKELRERINDHDLLKRLIGQFGLGFLSCFTLADRKVEILTRSAQEPNASGHMWTCYPNGKYEYSETNLPESGTRVMLYIGDTKKRGLVQGENLARSVKLYGDFLPYPIFDRLNRRLNVQIPPWQKADATHSDYAEYIGDRFGWDPPLFAIPILPQDGVDMEGIVFIPEDKDFLNRTGAVDLYVRNVLIRQDCPNILPDYFMFLAGVVNASGLRPILSREDVMRNVDYQLFQKALTKRIVAHLSTLHENTLTLKRVMAAHGRELKLALLQNADLFSSLAGHIPLRTGTPGEYVTLNEYVRTAAERPDAEEQKRIYYYRSISPNVARLQINRVLASRRIDVLEVVEDAPGRSQDHVLLKQYAAQIGLELCDAEELDDLFVPIEGWAEVEGLFSVLVSGVDARQVSVRTTEFEPHYLPLLVFNPKHGDLRETLSEMESKFSGMGESVQRVLHIAREKLDEDESMALLLLNSKNPEMKLLKEKVQTKVAQLVAVELYNLAMEYSGYAWSGRDLDLVREGRQRIISLCLSAAESLDQHLEEH